MTPNTQISHEWEMDSLRTRLEIGVIVYRCQCCGCLQIKNGGPDAPSVFKPTYPGWNPFKTLSTEPPCEVPDLRPSAVSAAQAFSAVEAHATSTEVL